MLFRERERHRNGFEATVPRKHAFDPNARETQDGHLGAMKGATRTKNANRPNPAYKYLMKMHPPQLLIKACRKVAPRVHRQAIIADKQVSLFPSMMIRNAPVI